MDRTLKALEEANGELLVGHGEVDGVAGPFGSRLELEKVVSSLGKLNSFCRKSAGFLRCFGDRERA